MRRRGWRAGLAPAVRRAVATVIALCLGLFQAETLLADVCDGDASAAEVAAFAGPRSDLETHGPTAVSTRASDGASSVTEPAPPRVGEQSNSDNPGGSDHTVHACHCVHAHGGQLPFRATLLVPPAVVASAVLGASERTPPSTTREPRPRPPAA